MLVKGAPNHEKCKTNVYYVISKANMATLIYKILMHPLSMTCHSKEFFVGFKNDPCFHDHGGIRMWEKVFTIIVLEKNEKNIKKTNKLLKKMRKTTEQKTFFIIVIITSRPMHIQIAANRVIVEHQRSLPFSCRLCRVLHIFWRLQ